MFNYVKNLICSPVIVYLFISKKDIKEILNLLIKKIQRILYKNTITLHILSMQSNIEEFRNEELKILEYSETSEFKKILY